VQRARLVEEKAMENMGTVLLTHIDMLAVGSFGITSALWGCMAAGSGYVWTSLFLWTLAASTIGALLVWF
jgi:hypothetical protein